MANRMKTPGDSHQQPAGEPRFGKQCKDSSSASSLNNVPNPGDKNDEVPPIATGASYERAGASGQPTKRIPGSVYKLEDDPDKIQNK